MTGGVKIAIDGGEKVHIPNKTEVSIIKNSETYFAVFEQKVFLRSIRFFMMSMVKRPIKKLRMSSALTL